ncbi:cell wall hydrolase [Streptomyces sp. NPDC014733]|uniref:cell wall hydrolase n=1 Tax=Streptomyces sp. NPDC014733 TaxID=3364885 RepID=UPI0036F9C678
MTSDTRNSGPGPYGPDPFGGLPAALRDIAYSAARHPGAMSPDGPSPEGNGAPGPPVGANCQLYAYAVLYHHGLVAPPLRSSELWADTVATRRVTVARPLDLVLFDGGPVAGRPEGYGAHVGVHLGPDRVLHLCKEVGRPAVWCYAEFAARARYARRLGFKRVVRTGAGPQSGERTG